MMTESAAQSSGALIALLDSPGYRRLLAAARRHLEQFGEAARRLTLHDLPLDEQRALASFLGLKRLPGATMRLRLDELDRALRASRVELGLREVLVQLGGPLTDRRADVREQRASEEKLWTDAAAHPALAKHPRLADWLSELRRQGLLRRAAGTMERPASAVLALLLDLLWRLPASGVLLQVLASELCGDAHALDAGQPLGTLLVRAAAFLAAVPPPATAAERRHLLAQLGVLCDPLSCDVLVLGLRPCGKDRLSQHLNEWAAAGEPRRLTLRELMGAALRISSTAQLFLCENPGVVASAADRLGPTCAPLICTEGVPSTALFSLLAQLRPINLRFHTDFDWMGLRIGNQLIQFAGALPWRMASADYEAGISRSRADLALRGQPVQASWDEDLHSRMEKVGRPLFEEQVLNDLLADLAS